MNSDFITKLKMSIVLVIALFCVFHVLKMGVVMAHENVHLVICENYGNATNARIVFNFWTPSGYLINCRYYDEKSYEQANYFNTMNEVSSYYYCAGLDVLMCICYFVILLLLCFSKE
jgi:hypothetical protein